MADKPPGTVPGQYVDEESGYGVRVPAVLDKRQKGQLYISFKAESDADRAKVLTALTGKVPKLTDKINGVVKIRNVIVQPVELTDEDSGEVIAATRSILLLHDGTMLGCCSEGIRQSLAAIFQLWGEPPWKEPLSFMVKQTDTASGGRWLTLEYAGKGSEKQQQ